MSSSVPFPRVGSVQVLKSPRGICALCGLSKSEMLITLEVNKNHADDQAITFHHDCAKDKPKGWMFSYLKEKTVCSPTQELVPAFQSSPLAPVPSAGD